MGFPMQCPSCGAENKETARFCAGCGTALSEPSGLPPRPELPPLEGASPPPPP